MKRLEYLAYALKMECYKRKAWVVSAFSITQDSLDLFNRDPYPGKLLRSPTMIQFQSSRDLEVIENIPVDQPLFAFKERVIVTPEMCPNVREPVETCIGNIIVNLACIVNAFGTKLPFVTGVISIPKIEDIVAARLKDTPPPDKARDPQSFYVDEYIRFVDSLTYITAFAHLTNQCATRKTITSAPGFSEFKKNLIETKYQGKLSDPIELAKLQAELRAFDEEYIKDDPTNGAFLSGKIKDTGRTKMHLILGADAGFGAASTVSPVTNSLDEGWSVEPKQFAAMMNGSRAGSFARGAETVKGGVTAKALLRAAGNVKVVDTDCGSRMWLPRTHDEKDIEKLIGRYIFVNKEMVLIKTLDEAKKWVGTIVMTRSPLYCRLEGDNFCKYCAGENLALNPRSVPTALTDMSAVVLASSMAAMHGKALKTTKLNIRQVFS